MGIVNGPLRDPRTAGSDPFRVSGFAAKDQPLVIGLVNNMPDAALSATERQFRGLLSDAAGERTIAIRMFAIPELQREAGGRAYVEEHCEDISELWGSRLDGLIVTGMEPRAGSLADEPYWPVFAKLVNWADGRTTASIWSCLAAHAAVLHADGVDRRRRAEKLSGLFDFIKTSDHEILSGTPPRWSIPHSRYNEVTEQALTENGYEVMLRSPQAGADLFIKRRNSLFIFFQGHPEYDADTLLREYRRDIGRFISGARDTYPAMPTGYFDEKTAAALNAFRERVMRTREPDLLSPFPMEIAAAGLAQPWRGPAVRLYSNWLSYLAEVSSERGAQTNVH